MSTWEWVLVGLIAWFAAALALGLWIGPVLKRWSRAAEAVDPGKEMPARHEQPSRHWRRAS